MKDSGEDSNDRLFWQGPIILKRVPGRIRLADYYGEVFCGGPAILCKFSNRIRLTDYFGEDSLVQNRLFCGGFRGGFDGPIILVRNLLWRTEYSVENSRKD